MKKLLVIGIVAVMMMGLAVAANATGDAWFVYMHVGLDTSALDGAADSKFGVNTRTTSQVSNNTSGGYSSAVPELWYSDATYALPADPNVNDRYYQVVWAKSKLAANVYQTGLTYNLRLVANAGTKAYLTAWNPTGTSADWDGTKFGYLTLFEVVNGKLANPYSFDKNANGSNDGTGMSGTYFQKQYTIGASGYQDFVLLASATNPILTTPEPGSMLAMLSGLVGLVGFGIRRRK